MVSKQNQPKKKTLHHLIGLCVLMVHNSFVMNHFMREPRAHVKTLITNIMEQR